MKKITLILIMVCIFPVICGYSEYSSQTPNQNNSDDVQARWTQAALAETQQEDLVTYAYIKSDHHGKLMFIGKCFGYVIPFVPQAAPNGLSMPTSSSAKWLMMIDPKTNKPRPVYTEVEIVVSPLPLPNY